MYYFEAFSWDMASAKHVNIPSTKDSFTKYLYLLKDKRKNLNNLINACEKSVEKLHCDLKENLQLIHNQRDDQVLLVFKFNFYCYKFLLEFLDYVLRFDRDVYLSS